MVTELICFLGGSLAVMAPGIWIAGALGLGNNRLERWTYGSVLGLALAVWFAAAISHIDLRGFYPVWGLAAVASLIAWQKYRPRGGKREPDDGWMWVLLGVVGVIRFALALPQTLPQGELDPTFHLLLARKIQLTHHAIWDWTPFSAVQLNYPTGSHALLVVLAAFTRLPLHTVFKDLIPLLGVITTSQVYVFARRATGSASTALYSAVAYGLWAWWGSNDYFRWGGLPNELAMLMFIAVLSLWLDNLPPKISLFPMAILYAGMVLVHHHLMVVSGGIIASVIVWGILRPRDGMPWKSLAAAVAMGIALDLFFLVPYAARAASLQSTGMFQGGETVLDMGRIVRDAGYCLVAFAVAGIVLCVIGRARCHSLVVIAVIVLGAMFIGGEYAAPMIERELGRKSFPIFTPSRFLTDMNYFLPIFAGLAVTFAAGKWKIPARVVFFLMLLGMLVDFQSWRETVALKEMPEGFLRAAEWVRTNTPKSTIVDSPENWSSYLTWRRSRYTPLPVSEPIDSHPQSMRIAEIESGQIPPDSPDLRIVAIEAMGSYTGGPILWRDPQSSWLVVQEWPPGGRSTEPTRE